jgi:hypothetical protein
MGHIFYFPSEGRYAEDFYRTGKIQRLRPGSNQRTRVPEASMLDHRSRLNIHLENHRKDRPYKNTFTCKTENRHFHVTEIFWGK